MSYFVPCNTDAPLTVYENEQLKFKVNGSLNKALLTHPYRSISTTVSASSGYTGSVENEYGRCGDPINPTPPGQPVRYPAAASVFTECSTEASSYINKSGSAQSTEYVTEYDDVAGSGWVLLNPCCAGDCTQKSSAAGGGGINAVLPGASSSGLSIARDYTSSAPYCTDCNSSTRNCNSQSIVFEAGVCRIRTEEEIKSIFCGDNVELSEHEPGSLSVFAVCAQADLDGVPFAGINFTGVPGRSYIAYYFSAGMGDIDCVQLCSQMLLSKLAENTQVNLIAPGAVYVKTSGTSAVAVFDNFTQPSSFDFSVTIYAEFNEQYAAPWGSGPYTETECTQRAVGYTQSISESYNFSYTETISIN